MCKCCITKKEDIVLSTRRLAKEIKIGNVTIGGENPVAVQSMTNTDTRNINATVRQIRRLERLGCEIVRVAIPDIKAAEAVALIKEKINIPLVADIHFDARLAEISALRGADKLRINPGNIGKKKDILRVVEAAINNSIPLRIGVNSGSIEPQILRKYGAPNGRALAASVLKQIKIIEKMGMTDIVLSAKAFDVMVAIEANRILSCETEYPIHLGITESGTLIQGVIRSAVGIGQLLSEGIGDTIRVSLSDKPEREISAGFGILKSLNMRKKGITVIACPTCGRTEIDVKGIAEKVEKELVFIKTPVTIAVMGCVVNGPGEARMADIGIAGGKKKGVIFQRGDIVKTVNENLLAEELIKRVKEIDKQGIMGGLIK